MPDCGRGRESFPPTRFNADIHASRKRLPTPSAKPALNGTATECDDALRISPAKQRLKAGLVRKRQFKPRFRFLYEHEYDLGPRSLACRRPSERSLRTPTSRRSTA